jgi:hypothetical protein
VRCSSTTDLEQPLAFSRRPRQGRTVGGRVFFFFKDVVYGVYRFRGENTWAIRKGEKKKHLHFVAFQLSLLDVGRDAKKRFNER